MDISSIKKGDYTYNYGSEGTTFLFQDIVAHYYNPKGGAITCHKNGKNTVYLSKDVIRQMDQKGIEITPQHVRDIIAKLEAIVKQVQQEIPIVNERDRLEKDFVQDMFKNMGEVCSLYEFFDYRYWDSVFVQSASDHAAKEKVDLVQNFKNAIRTELNAVFFDDTGYLPTMIQKLSSQFSIPITDLNWYSESDIIGLFEGTVTDQQIITARREMHVFVNHAEGYEIYTGNEAKQIIDEFDAVHEKPSSIKGMVANGKGTIVSGVVFVMNRNYASTQLMQEEMSRMKRGEILVSETTDPDLMPVLQKAAAVITDTGGLLSHAAITARELGIPCIVGTGMASKILQNGDTVEIDTEKGIIRIVN